MAYTLYRDADWLRHQYIVLEKSMEEIALEAGCSHVTILEWMRRFGIHSRTRSEAMRIVIKSEDYIRKQSESHRGDRNVMKIPEIAKKNSDAKRGKPFSKERCRHISEALKGKPSGRKGIPQTEEQRRKNSECHKGLPSGNKGHHISPELRAYYSRIRKGKNTLDKHPNWKGGKSFEPYCTKFNRNIKEEVREAFGNKCFLCGDTPTNCKLHIHHCDYNKGQGCGKRWSLVPLCNSCHTKTNFHRYYWFNLLSNHWAMQYLSQW